MGPCKQVRPRLIIPAEPSAAFVALDCLPSSSDNFISSGEGKQQRQIHRGASLILVFFLCSFATARQAVPGCCRQKSCPCHLLELLHGMGNHAAGILTLGKRSDARATKAFQNRLYHLLHGSSNQAAGILTMGKRAAELAPQHQEGTPGNQPAPASFAAGPDLAKGCLVPLDKDLASCQKLSNADTVY
ncbi:UNVERIFIED_CONTAM: hypothetical protein K2H54_018533 [Gekko kuhli]